MSTNQVVPILAIIHRQACTCNHQTVTEWRNLYCWVIIHLKSIHCIASRSRAPCTIKKSAQTRTSNSIRRIATMAKDTYRNGVKKTVTVPRSIAGFRPASGFVAAIDFGTTYCSLAYSLQRDTEIIKLPLDGPHTRVPNAILIERGKNTVEAFGYRAQTMFSQTKQREKYIYFERMKMILYRRKVSLHS